MCQDVADEQVEVLVEACQQVHEDVICWKSLLAGEPGAVSEESASTVDLRWAQEEGQG